MGDWQIIDSAEAELGDDLVLSRFGEKWVVHSGPTLLMASDEHHSEDVLADLALSRFEQPLRVLIGGLGLGFTLRAALNRVPRKAKVLVAETSRALLRWNQSYLSHLAGHPLRDRRAEVKIGDVADRIAEAEGSYDAILLDVDNGPVALVHATNQRLYDHAGSRSAFVALRPGGVLAVWSGNADEEYEKILRDVGFAAETVIVPVATADGGAYAIFIGTKPG